jgi:Anti-sigma factor NepR
LKDDALAERPVTDHDKGQDGTPARKSAKSSQADVGVALRQAFQAAVNEEVPDELLELLRRLD